MNDKQQALLDVLAIMREHSYDVGPYWENYVAQVIFGGIYQERTHWINLLEAMIEQYAEVDHG